MRLEQSYQRLGYDAHLVVRGYVIVQLCNCHHNLGRGERGREGGRMGGRRRERVGGWDGGGREGGKEE